MPHEDRPPVVIVERSNGVGSFLLGAILGAGAALLFAPRTGQETRDVLRSKGRQLRSTAEERAGELQTRLEDGYERAKARVEDRFDSARRGIDDTREGARDAMAAGKAAVQSARDELERRLSDSKAARRGEELLDEDDIEYEEVEEEEEEDEEEDE
jgi:gas vesicle protein